MEDFATYIEKQRAELHKKHADLVAKRDKLAEDIGAIDRELAAITAYEQTKAGVQPKAPRATGQKRERRGGVKDTVIAAIQSAPEGINRGDLLVKLEAKGNPKGEASISAVLAKLKKDAVVTHENGIYKMVAG